jgi:hypothetical protein
MSMIINRLNQEYSFASQDNHPRLSFSTFGFRPLTLGLLLVFSLLTILSCGLDIEDPTPPSPPVWVQKSLPDEWPERGIDAHESGGIYLEWEPNLMDEDIIAYIIQRATYYPSNDSLSNFNNIKRLEANSATETNFIDMTIYLRINYFYKLLAEDASGNQSNNSDSISYILLPSVSTERMWPNGQSVQLGFDRRLRWFSSHHTEFERFILSIVTDNSAIVVREEIMPGDYVNGHEFWAIPEDVTFESGEHYHWRIDLSGRMVGNHEYSGSESSWATFLFVE